MGQLFISSFCFSLVAAMVSVLLSSTLTASSLDINFIEQTYDTCIISRVKIIDPLFTCNLMEWIEYHHHVGISHMFIVDDCSPDSSMRDALLYYRKRGLVTPFSSVLEADACSKHSPDDRRLGHLMFKRHAVQMCTWVTYIDIDEYMTAWNWTNFNLKSVLDKHPAPYYRLPWWVIGSDGHETRPRALTIDAYRGGRLQASHLKTFARSQDCLDFSFPLHPFVARPEELLSAYNMTRKAYTHTADLHPFEHRTIDQGGPVNIPATTLFLKHYLYLSWDEFRAQRANYTRIGGGDANSVWAVDPRNKWLGGNWKPRIELAQEFTSHMSALVLASFKSEHANGTLPGYHCHVLWGL
jgi:hypothetical protein